MFSWQKEQYFHYHDVVYFDTTFCTNKFKYPLAALIGMDGFGRTVVFALALLKDETCESFEWLFESILLAVPVAPKIIFTDEDLAMKKAIEKVFPDAKHRLCAWHLERNLKKKVLAILGAKVYEEMRGHFWNLVQNCKGEQYVQEQFENMYKLCKIDNKVNANAVAAVDYLVDREEYWVKHHSRSLLHFDQTSTSRAESMNSLIKRTIKKNCKHLDVFIKELNAALTNEQEAVRGVLEYNAVVKQRIAVSQYPFCHAYPKNLTPFAIRKIEDEVRFISHNMCYYECNKDNRGFRVRYHKDNTERIYAVTVDDEKNYPKHCSCGHVNTWGLPCKHMCFIAIIHSIPSFSSECYSTRWFMKYHSSDYFTFVARNHRIDATNTSQVTQLLQKTHKETEQSKRERKYASLLAEMKALLNVALIAGKEMEAITSLRNVVSATQPTMRQQSSNNNAISVEPPTPQPAGNANKKQKINHYPTHHAF